MEVNDDPHPVVAMVAHTYIKVQVNIHTYRVSIDTHVTQWEFMQPLIHCMCSVFIVALVQLS